MMFRPRGYQGYFSSGLGRVEGPGTSVTVFPRGLTSVELLNNGVRLTTLGEVPVPSDHKSFDHKSLTTNLVTTNL